MKMSIPYYKKKVIINIDDERVNGIMVANELNCNQNEKDIVIESMHNPIVSQRLSELARDKKSVLIITSDHTRPVPSKITMPLILSELRANNPNINVKIIIATGYHKESTYEELVYKFGEEIVQKEKIVMHVSTATSSMVYKGKLPSGLELYINKAVDDAELIISEGFIEPHFFAGFSGGRKSILPGIAYYTSVLQNHCSEFLADPNARTGNLIDNPLHLDMVEAAKKVSLTYILNVVLDDDKRITHVFSGCPFSAHERGCAMVAGISGVKAIKSDIVVTSNGGYPLDQNVYQAVKGLTTAESCVNEGGVIIMLSSCSDGHGGQEFSETFKNHETSKSIMDMILATRREDTIPDQWESQMLARVQMKATIIIVSMHVKPQLIRDMKMLHSKTFDDALMLADEILGKKCKITVIPDGVKVIAL